MLLANKEEPLIGPRSNNSRGNPPSFSSAFLKNNKRRVRALLRLNLINLPQRTRRMEGKETAAPQSVAVPGQSAPQQHQDSGLDQV